MHFIQKHILDMLRSTDSLHYAELKPDEVESGHFRYHLQQLVKDGYVEQQDRGVYSLSQSGKKYVDRLSANRVNAKVTPKIITYTLLVDGNNLILQRKDKEPYRGLINMIGGKLHEGEVAAEASKREVFEKTGTRVESPELKCVAEILISVKGELLSHVVAFVFTANARAIDFDDQKVEIVDSSKLEEVDGLAPDFLPLYKYIETHKEPGITTITLDI